MFTFIVLISPGLFQMPFQETGMMENQQDMGFPVQDKMIREVIRGSKLDSDLSQPLCSTFARANEKGFLPEAPTP